MVIQRKVSTNVAVIAEFGGSNAIWNCIKQHINLMMKAGANIIIYLPITEPIEIIQDEYRPRIVLYSNKKELKRKVKEKDISIIWYPTNISMFHYGRLGGHYRIILWIQGSDADESWMRNRSRIRVWALNFIEFVCLHRADGLIHVSASMLHFFEVKYKHSFRNNAIVPCISDFNDYEPRTERIPESYVYIGGLSKWQCFEEIVDIYTRVRTSNSVLHIITMEIEKAKEIVKKKVGEDNSISVYSITDRSRIPDILSRFQYGFLIRKDSPVNYVSSPIKFLEYLSCGVNVIMTDAVPSYARLIKENNVGTIVDFKHMESIKINPFSPHARQVYKKFFSPDRFIDQYRNLLKNALNDNRQLGGNYR